MFHGAGAMLAAGPLYHVAPRSDTPSAGQVATLNPEIFITRLSGYIESGI